jgi:hypothetical protein
LENLAALMVEASPGEKPDAQHIVEVLESLGYVARVTRSPALVTQFAPDRG